MRDWDQHIDEVMGAYNSTCHATTGFSPYMLTRGMEKAIPLTYLYPEFATRSFETHEAYVEQVLARQQEIYDLVRRNTHQAQQRQKLKYDRAIRANAYKLGDYVWVFCRYIPQKGSPKLMKAWRGTHKVAQVLQEGRVHVLDNGLKVHFERLKAHHNGPTEWATMPLNDGDVAVIVDPEPERSAEEIPDDCSQPSYREEEPLSEATNVSSPPRQSHWMDTRLRTRIREGGSRLQYQQFDYSSGSDTDPRGPSDVLLSSAQELSQSQENLPSWGGAGEVPGVPPTATTAQEEEVLFSEHEMVPVKPELTQPSSKPLQVESKTNINETSLSGTSAPLLNDPSLTDILSNYPIWPNVVPPSESQIQTTEPVLDQSQPPNVMPSPDAPGHQRRRRGRPPRVPDRCSTRRSQLKRGSTTTTMGRGATRRGRMRGRPPRTATRANSSIADSSTLPSETSAPSARVTTDQESPATTRYHLRRNRVPRYRCGTCGLRDCTCVELIKSTIMTKPEKILNTQIQSPQSPCLVHRIVIRAEKTYTGLERNPTLPLERIMSHLFQSEVTKAPCLRFKEWTSDHKGLEFTLPVVVPPVPNNVVFGPFNFEREPIQMVRCITADLLHDQYGILLEPGNVYQPARNWWLMITAQESCDLVHPNSLRSCLECLRTEASTELILCFQIVDLCRGKLKFQWWLELIVALLSSFPRIRFLDEWTHTFSEPVSIQSALEILDTWSRMNTDNRP